MACRPKQKARGHGERQSRKTEQLIAALLAHATVEQAAAAVGIAKWTAWKWMRDPDFQRAYQGARTETLRQATAQLRAAATKAVKALADICEGGQMEAARVSAARAILESAFRAHELEDLAARIAALESSMEANYERHKTAA
jgi:hypothetical protein